MKEEDLPKYKIGDIVVYVEKASEKDDYDEYHQSKILGADGYIDSEDPKDNIFWNYKIAGKLDGLSDEEILCKIE